MVEIYECMTIVPAKDAVAEEEPCVLATKAGAHMTVQIEEESIGV